MIPIINLPVKIVRLFTSNIAPSEIAAGVCLGMFMGFMPLNGPMAIVLFLCFFVFKINRLSAMLVLPFFKLLYVAGMSSVTDAMGGVLLIKAGFLAPFWGIVTHMPVLALLDLNNTLVSGGLFLSGILTLPVYVGAMKGVLFLREKYFDKMKNTKFVRWFLKLPLIDKAITISGKLKGDN